MKSVIEDVIVNSGLWDGNRRETHRFLLTPDVFPLTSVQVSDLKQMGEALVECMEGMSRIIAIAKSGELGRGLAWKNIQAFAKMQVQKEYCDLQVARPKQIPRVMKVDLVEGEDGHLSLVEIDAMNRRGLGYTILMAQIRDAVKPGATTLPGIPELLAKEARQREESRLVLLYNHKERFYLPEFHILRDALASKGIELIVADEQEFRAEGERIFIRGVEEAGRLFINFPVLDENPDVVKSLTDLYLASRVKFLIPPKPALGSKGLVGILRNDEGDEALEAILRSQINSDALAVIRRHIPETRFVRKYGAEPEIAYQNQWVLKEAIASGAKGVVFSTDERFARALAEAKKADGRYVLQRVVRGKQRLFRYYLPESDCMTGAMLAYTRLVAYFVAGELADIGVTGTSEKLVHGGKNAVFMGTTIE